MYNLEFAQLYLFSMNVFHFEFILSLVNQNSKSKIVTMKFLIKIWFVLALFTNSHFQKNRDLATQCSTRYVKDGF